MAGAGAQAATGKAAALTRSRRQWCDIVSSVMGRSLREILADLVLRAANRGRRRLKPMESAAMTFEMPSRHLCADVESADMQETRRQQAQGFNG